VSLRTALHYCKAAPSSSLLGPSAARALARLAPRSEARRLSHHRLEAGRARQGLGTVRCRLHGSVLRDRGAVRGLSVDEALIDGEVVVLRDDGRSEFGALMTKRGGGQASLVACRRLMTIPGVGQPTALAFVAAIDDPAHTPIARCRRLSGPGSRRHQSGEVDYVSGISKCGDSACEPSCTGRQRHADALQGPAPNLRTREYRPAILSDHQ
jgi:transposase